MKLDRIVFAITLAACSASPQNDASGAFSPDAYASLTTDAGTYRVEIRTSPSQPPVRTSAADDSGAPVRTKSPLCGLFCRS